MAKGRARTTQVSNTTLLRFPTAGGFRAYLAKGGPMKNHCHSYSQGLHRQYFLTEDPLSEIIWYLFDLKAVFVKADRRFAQLFYDQLWL